jgi:hypothetical protein
MRLPSKYIQFTKCVNRIIIARINHADTFFVITTKKLTKLFQNGRWKFSSEMTTTMKKSNRFRNRIIFQLASLNESCLRIHIYEWTVNELTSRVFLFIESIMLSRSPLSRSLSTLIVSTSFEWIMEYFRQHPSTHNTFGNSFEWHVNYRHFNSFDHNTLHGTI